MLERYRTREGTLGDRFSGAALPIFAVGGLGGLRITCS